jgi:hypothetical protein
LTGFDLYPGDDVVDIISVDFYEKNISFANALNGGGVNLTNLAAFAASHNKLIGIPEWATQNCDGSFITAVANWCDSMGTRMAYQSYYDEGLGANGDNVVYTTRPPSGDTDACPVGSLQAAWNASSFGTKAYGGTWSPVI